MKTTALFLDAYRELNSKKLFWITMLLSGLVVAIFGAIGLRENGVSFLWWTIPIGGVNSETIDPATFYKGFFTGVGVRFWLSIIATVLALVTTAGMIPDFISGGSIELMLSKPISRTRLYLTKFFTGLLFVALQVLVFSVCSMLVIGLRGGVWEPGILLAVPIVVLFYSYLFCVCTLLGLITRSTLASLLLTILFWFMLFLLNQADQTLLMFQKAMEAQVQQMDQRLEASRQTLEELRSSQSAETESPETTEETKPIADGFAGRIAEEFRAGRRAEDMGEEDLASRIRRAEFEIREIESDREQAAKNATGLAEWSGIIVSVKTVLPKTADTIDLLDRHLISEDAIDRQEERAIERQGDENFSRGQFDAMREIRSRSLWWVVGTSLLFEAFILAIGAWIFSRRDF